MNLQIIHSPQGEPEYVLLPIQVYQQLRPHLQNSLQKDHSDYIPFELENYIQNPITLARIKNNMTQEALAKAMKVSQAYISKIERQKTVTPKLLNKIQKHLKSIK